MDKQLQILDQMLDLLLGTNAAVPIVLGAIAGISAIIRTITGTGPTLVELADRIEAKIARNDEAGRAEIARLRAKLAEQGL